MFDKAKADHAVNFINCLKHTKGRWRGVPFELLPWQDEIIRTLYGTVKENGYRQYNTCYCEIPKKNGKSELAAAIALYMTCGDGEWGAEVYGCASDRQQASIVFDVAVDMVDQCPALKKRIKPVMSVKRLVYKPNRYYVYIGSNELDYGFRGEWYDAPFKAQFMIYNQSLFKWDKDAENERDYTNFHYIGNAVCS